MVIIIDVNLMWYCIMWLFILERFMYYIVCIDRLIVLMLLYWNVCCEFGLGLGLENWIKVELCVDILI